MYDLHNHLLPGVDDGAKDWDMALAMARMAYADGIRGMVCTPHNSAWWNHYFEDKIAPLTREFAQRVRDAGLEMEIGAGSEIYIDLDILKRLQDGRAAPLNGTRYLLVELPFTSWPLYAEQVVFELQTAGYIVILAHPERYTAVMEKPYLMQGMADRGVIGQVTSGSLEGKFGSRAQKTAMQLIENHWAHYIATDAHELSNRTPTLRAAHDVLKAHFGEAQATAMCVTIPRQIFHDEEVSLETPHTWDSQPHRSLFSSLFRRQ
ncbi:MAG: protein-tyrosine-phosphatase [Chloroflexi bacterium]|nr:protein-tyrosine-phosphatase [Chloroflexota bacterium]